MVYNTQNYSISGLYPSSRILNDQKTQQWNFWFHEGRFLERFQSKALRMIVDAPWKKSAATALNTVFASVHIQMTW
jgi:hypothetical protein